MRAQSTAIPNPETKWRLALTDWAAGLLSGDPRPWPDNEGSDADRSTEDFFRDQGIAPLCHYQLEHLGAEGRVPEPVWAFFRKERQAAAALDLMWGYRDAQVLGWLREIGLRPLVLKGAAYARSIYPEPHLRPRCDTDLLFSDQDSAEAALARLQAEGYEVAPNVVAGRLVSRQRTCYSPRACGHAIDVHWAISNTHSFVRALPYPELDQQAVPLPGLSAGARTLGPRHSLLYACLHLFGHEASEPSTRLLWLYDIHRLGARLDAAGWTAFARLAITKQVAGVCRHVLDQTTERFPLPRLAPVRPALCAAEPLEVFRPDRLKTSLHYLYYDLQALEGWAERLRWLRETLLPSADYMRAKYGTTNDLWLPLLYLGRSAAGLARRLRQKPDRRAR